MNEFITSLKDNNNRINDTCHRLAILSLEIAMAILIVYTFFGLFRIALPSFVEVLLCAVVMLLSLMAVCCVFKMIPQWIKIAYVISVGCFIFAYLFHTSGLTYLLNTLFTINLLLLFVYIHPPKLLCISTYIVLAFIVVLVVLFAPQFHLPPEGNKFLNLNTNTSGYILFTFFFITVYYACGYKTGSVKGGIFFLIAVLTFFAQLRYDGRSSVLGDVLAIVCLVLKKYIENLSAQKIKQLIFALSMFSIIFTYIYAIVLFNGIGSGNWLFMHKDFFSGRQVIWKDAFNQLNGHIFLGIGNRLRSMSINGDVSGFTNVHNQMLGYIVTFGLVGTFPFLVLFSNISSLYAKRYAMMISYVLILLIMAYFDTIIYATDNMKYNCLALVIIAGLSRYKENRECKKSFITVGSEAQKNPIL